MKHTVFITGASRGIGFATAKRFAKTGHCTVIHCNTHREEAETLLSSLQSDGCEAMVVQGDISSEADVCRMVGQVHAKFGKIDVLVNNAGIALPQGLITDCTAADWDTLFAVNVRGTFLMSRAVLPDMVGEKRGSIVNVSSMWGVSGASCEVPYSASKAAIIGFTKALAKEVAPSGIRVNCVAPGFVLTEMNAHLSEADREAFRLDTPLERLGTVEDIAASIAFLALDESRFITGQVLSCDGGCCI